MIDQYQADARERIEQHREEAFVELPRPLWLRPDLGRFSRVGPFVAPLTWRRLHQLQGEGNRILSADILGMPGVEILRALWILSPDYRPTARAFRRFLWCHTLGLTLLRNRWRLVKYIRAHIDDAFMERTVASSASGDGSGDVDIPSAHYLAQLIVSMGSLGLCRHPADVLDLPVAMTFQILNSAYGHSSQPGEPRWNLAQDRANGERLRRLKRERMAAKKGGQS